MAPIADSFTPLPKRRIAHRSSSILKKYLLAASGLFLVLYLIVHLAGNLTLFLGVETFDRYATFLLDHPALPLVEALLFLVFALHIATALMISLANRRAREIAYKVKNTRGQASLGSRTMLLTGSLLGLFLVFHVVHYAVGHAYHLSWIPDGMSLGTYVQSSLANPWIALTYAAGTVLTGVHVSHGLWSGLHTLGLNNTRVHGFLYAGSQGFGLILAIGFLAIVVQAFLG